MGRQTRSPRAGSADKFVSPNVVTSSSVAVAIPNYGVTDVTTWGAGDYVLDAPDEGVRKLLVQTSSTATSRVIRCSTGTSVKVNNQLGTQITLAATVDQSVGLIGLNSTRWLVLYTNGSPTIGTS